MFYKESNTKEIVISKLITIVVIIYLLSFLKPSLFNIINTKSLNFFDFYWFCIFKSLSIFQFIFQIFLIIKLIFPIKSKYNFTNLERGFHPFFMYNGRFNYFIILGLLGLVQPSLEYYFENQTNHNYYGLVAYFHFLIMFMIMLRNNSLNKFPIEFIKSNKVRLLVKYKDYINHKIADDEPHLTINQNFDVNLKSLPRNDSEKNLIEIKNPNTPINPALVYKIEDKDLADVIRDGYVLKAKLVEIKEEGNLEIELYLKEKKQD